MTRELAVAGELGRLQRAAELVVVGDGDRAEADRLGVVEQILDRDRAVVRVRRVHVQVDSDPRAAGERVAVAAGDAPAAGEARGRGGRARRRPSAKLWRSAVARAPDAERGTQVVVLGEPGDGGGGELGLGLDARRRRRSRAAHASASSRRRRLPSIAGTKIAASPKESPRARRRRARDASGRGPRAGAARTGCPESGRVRSSTSSQPGSSSSIRITPRATGRSRPRHSRTICFRLRPGRKSAGVDAGGDDAVVAGEALGGGRRVVADDATSASMRPSSRSRCALPGG